jgi:multidrug efflux pump subunit AcrA (membrane-fusion protein)
MEINPSMWRYDHQAVSNVGIGASDDEVMANMSTLLAISQQLKATGSTLTDDVKIYNMLDKAVKTMGQRDTSQFFNNPEIPEETLMAQYEQLLTFAEQAKMQLEQQNPLAQAEQVKAQASLLNTQIKEQSNQQKNELDLAKMLQEQNQFNAKLAEDQRQFNADMIAKMNELELQYSSELINKTPDV